MKKAAPSSTPTAMVSSKAQDLYHDLVTIEQAADFLQMSPSTIRSYIRQDKLKAFRIAGKRKVLIPRQELMKLLEPVSNKSVS